MSMRVSRRIIDDDRWSKDPNVRKAAAHWSVSKVPWSRRSKETVVGVNFEVWTSDLSSCVAWSQHTWLGENCVSTSQLFVLFFVTISKMPPGLCAAYQRNHAWDIPVRCQSISCIVHQVERLHPCPHRSSIKLDALSPTPGSTHVFWYTCCSALSFQVLQVVGWRVKAKSGTWKIKNLLSCKLLVEASIQLYW